MENIEFNLSNIFKSNDDFSSFTAVIMEPDVDLHGDIVSEDVIKKAAHDYLKRQKMESKIEHSISTNDISLVESFILDEDKIFNDIAVKKGSWLGKFQVNSEEIKKKIQNGDIKGVSIGATAIVEDIQKSIENPFKNNPKRRIKEIKDINEISIVSYPANNKEILQLNKSSETNKGEEMTFEEIMEAVNSNPELKKQLIDELSIANEEKTEDDIKKGLDPKVLEILKAKEDRLLILEKAYEETIRKEFSSKVAEIKKYAKCEDSLTDVLLKVSKSLPNEYKLIEKTLMDSIDTIKKMDLTKSLGSDNHLDMAASTGYEHIEVIAKGLMSKDKGLTKEQAIAKVYQQKLYVAGE